MERIIKFAKAFNRRDPDPKKNYGIDGVTMYMGLKGDLGTVVLVIHTNWHTKKVADEFMDKDGDAVSLYRIFMPMAGDIGYHSPKKMFEGQQLTGSVSFDWNDTEEHSLGGITVTLPKMKDTNKSDPCEWLDGNPCYSGGSAINAGAYFETLVEHGEDAFWKKMEDYYVSIFGELC